MSPSTRTIIQSVEETNERARRVLRALEHERLGRELGAVKRRFENVLRRECAPLLNAAEADGRISASDRAEFERRYAQDAEATIRHIQVLTPNHVRASENARDDEAQGAALAEFLGLPQSRIV